MKLADMTWKEATEKCKDKIILIPHGSTEQHGYHLPLKTDAFIAEKVCEIFYDSKDVVVAPVMNYTGVRAGKFKLGTVGPNADEYEEWLKVIISDFMKLKPGKVFFFLGHDGKTQRLVLNKLIEVYGDKLGYLGAGDCDINDITETGGHAGEGETSLMLYLDPKNVQMDKAVDEPWPEDTTNGISESGSDGFPTKATAEKGKLLLEL
ncbi:MAG: creatininase family protein, partial [Nanoarchaeota archaeon]|nr:creatininase family protein [Nanoarchaeota archaeon]